MGTRRVATRWTLNMSGSTIMSAEEWAAWEATRTNYLLFEVDGPSTQPRADRQLEIKRRKEVAKANKRAVDRQKRSQKRRNERAAGCRPLTQYFKASS